MVSKPEFIDSPFFYTDDEGFHLKDGAPPEVVKEFNEFMEEYEEAEKRGVLL